MLTGQKALAYTAGIVDGEGCIHLMKTKSRQYSIRVIVSNTNEWLIQWLKMEYGGVITKRQGKGKRKTVYRWTIATARAADFLTIILPYLMLKRSQAELALKFQANRATPAGYHRGKTKDKKVLDEAQYLLMKSYNKRGVDATV